MQGTAQRFALPACGRAEILFESRKNSKPEKCLKKPQTPTRQVHALLGGFFAIGLLFYFTQFTFKHFDFHIHFLRQPISNYICTR